MENYLLEKPEPSERQLERIQYLKDFFEFWKSSFDLQAKHTDSKLVHQVLGNCGSKSSSFDEEIKILSDGGYVKKTVLIDIETNEVLATYIWSFKKPDGSITHKWRLYGGVWVGAGGQTKFRDEMRVKEVQRWCRVPSLIM